jgi:hypothetical protein
MSSDEKCARAQAGRGLAQKSGELGLGYPEVECPRTVDRKQIEVSWE